MNASGITSVGIWDVLLLLGVTLQATAIAYAHSPRAKALLYCIPIPFTFASLALGTPIGVTHVLGLPLVLLYTHAVRWLHVGLRLPIVASIVLCALGYSTVGVVLAKQIPSTDMTFWAALATVGILGAVLCRTVGHRDETGHRSSLPVGLKLAIIGVVITMLVLMKRHLGGFMTLFPMVGVIAAYEARHSLWTLARQVPVLIVAMIPMMAICRLLQGKIGLGPAIILGWVGYAVTMLLFSKRLWPASEVRNDSSL